MADADQQPKRYQYHGELGQTALPEMLYTVYQHRVPGIIECHRGDVLKRVYLRDGAVIHASSTDRVDSLGTFLRRTERISAEQFVLTDKIRAATADKRHGELLIEHEILSPAQLYEAIQEQIRSVVWSLFSWDDGEVTFSIGDFEEADMVRIYLPMRQMILQGVKRVPDAKALVSRLGRKDTIFEPIWSTEDLIEVAVDEIELKLLRQVDGKRSLYDVCTHGPFTPPENARIIYAFHVLRLIRRRVAERPGVVKLRLRSEPAAGS
ncbi:MAG TPA: DUF4388 domain-containing protein [Thermoanaerobaculia bacterium]|jgi:hypothetical protein|nr:DUF4388 domain-containing protein [Thermoanaerobaculia bacterium]